MRKIITTVLIILSLDSTLVQATTSIKAQVNGLVCAFCAQGIDKKMRALPQTKDVYVNLKQKIVVVELKDGQTLEVEIFKTIIKDSGYVVVAVDTVEKTAQQIKLEGVSHE
jgi:mercuric ion binding protein